MDLMKNIEQILNNEEINKLFIINGYNKLILTDTAGKTLKEINLDVNSRDAIYGAYRLK